MNTQETVLNLEHSIAEAVVADRSGAFWPISPSFGKETKGLTGVTRAILWFRQVCVSVTVKQKTRRLRVTETISLGEKRFLSIISVDGVEYLIGGGTATVAVLTRLRTQGDQEEFPHTLHEVSRRTEPA